VNPCVTLKIEASDWALVRSDSCDVWARSWRHWPEEKALAARVSIIKDESTGDGHYRWICWGLYTEHHIGYGREATLQKAKDMADATLFEYCRASETRS
jgi:hypothetical protein